MVFDSDAVLNALKGRTSLGCDNGPLSGLPPTLGRSNPLDDKDVQNRLICVRYPCAILARWHGSQPSVIGRRGITTGGQVALVTLGYRKVIIRIRKSAGLGYSGRVGQPSQELR